MALTSSGTTALFGSAVTLTATVTPATATGNVTFYDGVTVLGTSQLASGVASFTTKFLAAGSGSLTARYWGDANDGLAASTPVPITVSTLPNVGFLQAATISSVTYANGMVAADFNGDGKADLAVANSTTYSVVVFLGNGDGSFQSPVSFLADGYPTGMAAGDFNGDGKTDLAVANGLYAVSVLLGNGDGTFQSAVAYGNYDASGNSVVVADINGDGKPDLAVATQSGAVLLFGKGDGTFQTASNFTLSGAVQRIAAGDFNADGIADVVVLGSNGCYMLLGKGDGSFQLAGVFSSVQNATGVVVGDFNGDAKQDLAIMGSPATSFNVFLGNGDGTFSAAVNYQPSGDQLGGIVGGDFNGDGVTDIMVGDPVANEVWLYQGNGDGTFQAAVPYTGARSPALVADFNGDGRADFVTIGATSAIFLGRAPYTTTTLTSSSNPSTYGQAVTLTAAVSPAAATGRVTFYDGTTILGSASLASGQATLTTSLIASGFRSLTAHYSGDSAQPASTSTALIQKVIALPSNGFQTGVVYPAGSGPTHIARGDFDGDGIADLVVPNPGANNVDVILGNGDGSFRAPMSYGAGTGPDFVAIGDFNGDGKPDLAVGDSGTNNVNILLGNGDGTFQAAVSYATTGPASSIAIGDFNGDGKADLAVPVGSGVNVFLGVGDGTFSAEIDYNGGSQPWALVAGDFNHDGKTDLAVANPTGGNVCILLGNGDGSFQNPVSYAAGSQPYAIAAGDFNHDGFMDLAVADMGDGSVDILLGKTGGAFQTAVNYAAGTGARSIAVEDFNGDGNPDLVVADNFSGGAVSVLFGNGKGGFEPAVHSVLSGAPDSVVIGNFTGDGRVDCAVTIPGSNGVNILVSQVPPPTTTTLTSSLNPSGYGQSVTLTATISLSTATGTVAFYDSGTLLGIAPVVGGTATLKTNQLAFGVNSLKAYYSGGTGLLSTSGIFHQTVNALPQAGFGFGVAYNAGSPFAVGDFNGDGKPDLAAVSFNSVNVLLNRGGGIFNAAVNYPAGYGPTSVAVGDFNGDGYSDLAVASSANGTINILLGNGDGTFRSPASFSAGLNLNAIAVSDLNGDGNADLIVSYTPYAYGINVYLGNGDGTFGSATNLLAGQPTYSIATGDFNGDGKADLAVVNGASSLFILIGKGDGGFLTPVTYSTGAGSASVIVADLNGDGIADVITASYGGNNAVSVFLGKSDGTFQTPLSTGAGNFPASLAVGDFNGDGKTDLAIADNNHNNVANGNVITILIGAGDGTFSGSTTISVGANPTEVMMADFNGDSRADLAVANSSTSVEILLGKAATGATTASVALTSSANPSTYGQSLAITATVTPSAATGRVAFYDGGALLGTVPMAGGSATLNTSLLSSGSHSLHAFYMGDGTYQATSSAALAQAVNPVATQGFQAGAGNPIAGGATSVATGDFNGDGRPDIAAVTSSGINILLGGSGGTFTAAPSLAINSGFQAIAAGDFNGDGKTDLITVGQVFLGNGDGTFQPPLSYQIPGAWTAGNATKVFVTDFNGDGFADALLTSGQNAWVVLLGNGDGTFSGTTYTGAGALGAGDFNGDGKPDVMLVETSIAGQVSIVIMLGNGDGTFSAAPGYVLGASSSTSQAPVPVGAMTADFDGDGKLDVAVIDYTYGSQGPVSALVVLKGDGDGTLQLARQYVVAGTANSLVTGDFDGDGKQDIAVGNTSGLYATTGIAVYYGLGNGSFNAAYPIAAPVSVLVTGDFNGDGRADLIAGSSSQLDVLFGLTPLIPTTVTLTASPGASIYHQTVKLTATASSGATGAVSFYQGATFLGSATISSGSAVFTTWLLTSWGGTIKAVYGGDATHSLSVSAPLTQAVASVPENGLVAAGPELAGADAMADVNGDGNIDLIFLTAAGNVGVYLGNGDGTFQAEKDSGAVSSGPMLVGDFNGDGKPDLAIGGNTVSISLGNGDGTFRVATTVANEQNNQPIWAETLVAGDFNGDGKQDIAFASEDYGSAGVLIGRGDGTFQPVVYYDAGSYSDSIATGDFNSDGKTDLAVTNSSSNNVSVLIGMGDGTFQSAVNYPAGQSPGAIVAADFNGDGYTDLAVANLVSNNVSVLLGSATGTFAAAVNYSTGRHPVSMAPGDFNGDGKIDLVVANELDSNLSILSGDGHGAFVQSTYALIRDAGFVETADVNNDGRTDIAVVDQFGATILVGRAPGPDLAITKTHAGTFSLNDSGFTYTLTVSNTGNVPSSGAVTVTDTLPAGLTATAIGGTGWNCDAGTVTCTASDPLAPAASYPAITVTVSVSGSAAASVTNYAAVSGGGDVNALNNSASDPTVISPVGQTPQMITFTSPGNQTGPGTVTLNASSDSGLTLVLTSNSPRICTVAGGIVTPLLSGTCSITASQPGNPTYAAAVSVTQTFTISPIGTTATVTLASAANPSAFGQPLTLTASVMPATATGHVTFFNGVTVLGVGTLANGTAALTTGMLSSGVDSLRVYYGGDLTYAPATSAVVSQTITANSAIGFDTQVTYVSGGGPAQIAQADFNGDGKTDLAVTIGSGVVILTGNGDGTFQSAGANIVTLQFSPTSIAAGDFNGDGSTDIAIGYFNSSSGGTVNILFNNGNGTFTAGTPVSVGGLVNITSLTAADFNGDGILDLGVTDGFVQVLLGNGDGTFIAGVEYGYGNGNAAVDGAVEDFNRDGKPDFALAIGNNAGMYVAAGNGDRTLQNPVTYAATAGPLAVVAGDFNGDGWPDIAVTSRGDFAGNPIPGTLSVYLNNGDGTFQTALTYSTGSRPNALTIGDFNGDGIRDLAVTSQDENGVRVFQGNGDGTFLAGVLYATGSSPLGVVAGDFNGDGRTDLVVANNLDTTVSVLLGTNLASQTITFTQPGDVTMGVAPFALTATASSGLTVAFASSNMAVCTVSGSMVSIVGTGKCSIVATQAGNSMTGPAPPVARSFTVSQGSQTITFAVIPDAVYGTPFGPGLSASASSGLALTFASNTPPVCSVSGNITYMNSAGTCSITATQDGDANWNAAAPMTRTFVISKASQTLDFPSPASVILSSTPSTLSASSSSGLSVSFSSSSPSVCTVSGAALKTFTTGMCIITASQAGNGGYTAAQSITANITIVPPLTLSAISVTPSAATGLTQTLSAVYYDPAGVSDLVAVSVLVNTAQNTQAACYAEYLPASNALVLFDDTGLVLVKGSITPGDTATLSNSQCTLASGGAVASSGNVLTVPFTITTNVGFSGAENVFGVASSIAGASGGWQTLGTWNVPGVPQTVSFAPLPNIPVSTQPFSVSATASSGGAVTFASTTPVVCTVSGSTVTIVVAGGCSITATQAGDSTYAAASTTQSFTVWFGDVAPGDNDYAAINAMAQHGITAGCGGNGFCPNENVTRDQMAIFIVRAIYGSDNFTYTTTPYFNDVTPTTFGFKWIQKLRDLGITSGCTASTYCPGEVVARDQMAVFIIRARLGLSIAGPGPTFTYPSTPYFTDATAGSEFAFPWIQRMKMDGITSGCTVTTYCPADPVTRGEMAIFIMRGAFNQFLPAGTPVISRISPATLPAGTSGTYTITGINTNFVQGTTQLSPIPGVTIGAITVNSATSMTVQLTAAANAVAQPYSIVAITGNEQDVLPNGLVIQ